eukprot:NODE_6111_length_291_cov_323.479339_g5499_i0.p1 GENE.NODE_6111_length_291_cov_323.479339_g5499_i0~~NODE_6111_length_291_cov_323.479339_g5499_i0.p1  ORF type:complete len:74 (+),score=22.00 NODE_6111_length_291_cov_323.479339_g5499_i0:30-224(+)
MGEQGLRIFAKVDEVMGMLMEALKMEVAPYEERDLAHDAEWLSEFSRGYTFRSTSSQDWFEGPH